MQYRSQNLAKGDRELARRLLLKTAKRDRWALCKRQALAGERRHGSGARSGV